MEAVTTSASLPVVVLGAGGRRHQKLAFPGDQFLPWRCQDSTRITVHYVGVCSYSLKNSNGRARDCSSFNAIGENLVFHQGSTFHNLSSWYRSGLSQSGKVKFLKYFLDKRKLTDWKEKVRHSLATVSIRLVLGVMLVVSVSLAVNKSPSWALTEENLLFLEAWRTIDRAYVDKTFNGQSWFRYREDALRNEPMNTREETYMAIRKMLSTLDDPFTRFLEPEKFRSLRSGTQGALTGVGLSIGYPTRLDSTGLIVISSSPGGPANKAGIVAGDIILAIDDLSTEDMDIYDAAERLQGTEGSTVELDIRSGSEIKHVALKRAKVTLNPVKSRLCETVVTGKDGFKVGYIKLTSFNQNASSAVKEAIETLRSNNVEAFVLDLRDNSGGLFPEGIKIAKIWLQKGVIVYICDSRGVRDIYETDGSDAMVASEPLAVLVNKGTASASEILAGALKDNRRAVVFGEPTFGKGKIQSVFELSDGSGLAVTVARYETPAHTDIDKVGVMPDHPLPASFPSDVDGVCRCLRDPTSPCNLDTFYSGHPQYGGHEWDEEKLKVFVYFTSLLSIMRFHISTAFSPSLPPPAQTKHSTEEEEEEDLEGPQAVPDMDNQPLLESVQGPLGWLAGGRTSPASTMWEESSAVYRTCAAAAAAEFAAIPVAISLEERRGCVSEKATFVPAHFATALARLAALRTGRPESDPAPDP